MRSRLRFLAALTIPVVVGGGLIALESRSRTLASESKDDMVAEVFLSRDRKAVYFYLEDRKNRGVFDHGSIATQLVGPYVGGSPTLNLSAAAALVRYNGVISRYTYPGGRQLSE